MAKIVVNIGVNLSEPHSNMENSIVIYVLKRTVWFIYKKNTMNLWILPYKCFVMQKYLALCTDISLSTIVLNSRDW